jgi:hypothetical protein
MLSTNQVSQPIVKRGNTVPVQSLGILSAVATAVALMYALSHYITGVQLLMTPI